MTASRFDPKWPNHAIERCSLTVALKEAVPEKLFAATTDKHKSSFERFGLVEQPAISVSFNMATGQAVDASGNVFAKNYTFRDQSAALTITPQALAWGTSRYTRWKQFKEQLHVVFFPIVESYLAISDVILIRLDYLDRFLWTGTWDDFDLAMLLRPDLNSMPLVANRAKQERHSHNGWFESNGRLRRLINRNLDVAQVPLVGRIGMQPSVGVYTLIQDEFVVQLGGANPLRDMSGVQQGIEQQHVDLKAMIADTISESMAKRIGLLPGGWHNASA